jgi:sodium/proline symporter
MIHFDPAIAATFIVYLLVVLGIGIVAWRRTANIKDYLLGGRSLGRWVTALSAQASDMSGWLLLGLPGYAYLAGMESIWLLVGLFVGTWANWRLVAVRLRRATEYYGDSLTLPDYFERRFDDRSGVLRLLSALFILVFFTFYTSSGLVAGGRLFEEVFGLPYVWAVLGGGFAIVAYTFFGGFLAVSWTDLIQGLLMFVALCAVAVLGLKAVGGPDGLVAGMNAANPDLLDAFTDTAGAPLGAIAIMSLLGWGLGYFGQPHILARFMAARSAECIPASRRIAMTWVALTLAAATLVGMSGGLLVEPPLDGADTEKVFMVLTTLLFHPVVAGICLSGILAAVMSTADSQLLVASSALAEDFYRGMIRKSAGPTEVLWAGRVGVIAIAAIAFALAMDPDSRVLELVAYAWAGLGAAFGPAIVASLYWRRMTRAGAIAGLLAGGLTVIVWKRLEGGWFDLYEIVPGVVAAGLAIGLVSLISGGHQGAGPGHDDEA